MHIGTPSQPDNYLDTNAPQKRFACDAAYTKKNANGGPALDRPDSEITVSTIKIFSMLD
jgi:hypothetical protein